MWRPLRVTKGCTSTIPTRVRRFASAQHGATQRSGARNATPPVSTPLDDIAPHLQTGKTLTKARTQYLEKKDELHRIRKEFQREHKAGIDDDVAQLSKQMWRLSNKKKRMQDARTTKHIQSIRRARLADLLAARRADKAKRIALRKMTNKFRAETWGKVRGEALVRNMVAEIRNGEWITMENMDNINADFLNATVEVPGLPAPGTYDTTEGIMSLTDTYFGQWEDPQTQREKSQSKKKLKFEEGKLEESEASPSPSSREGQVHERPITLEEIASDDEPKLEDVELPEDALSAEERARLESFKAANPEDAASSSPQPSSSSTATSSSSSLSSSDAASSKSSPYTGHKLDKASFDKYIDLVDKAENPTDVRTVELLERKLHSFDDLGAHLRTHLDDEAFVEDIDSMNRVELDAMLRYLDEQVGESLEKYSDKQKVVL